MSEIHDLIDELSAISAGSELAESRQFRAAATEHTRGSYQALFSTGSESFPLALRAAIAAQVADWHQSAGLLQHYLRLAEEGVNPQRLSSALSFARRLTFQPVAATPADLAELQQAGWQTDEIITLAQLVSFVSFQSRLIHGFTLLESLTTAAEPLPVAPLPAPVTAGRWHTQPKTAGHRQAPLAFTRKPLGWEPWLPAKPFSDFSPQGQESLRKFGHQDSDYFRLLGRDQPVLEQRTLTDKGIFYTHGGLARAERELATTVVSKVNGCIYCASVHARKASQLSKLQDEVALLLQVQPGDPLSDGQSARWQAEIEAVAALSLTPPQLTTAHLQALQQLPLSTLEITDLIQSAAFFAWANRLMLTLGEPFIPAETATPATEKTTSA